MAYHRTLVHVNDRPGLIFMTSIFIVIGTLSVILRFYSRRLTKLPLGPDDWFALSSLVGPFSTLQ
jgi:hypothetical protein